MGFVKLEAVGRETGNKWDHMGQTQIIQIMASYGHERLNSLQFHYLDQNQSVHKGSPYFAGRIFNTFTFEGLTEHITKVEGIHSSSQPGFVKLRIHTNVKEYVICDIKVQPSYATQLQCFSFDFGGLNQFGGFHGSYSSSNVSSIGVYFKQLTVPPQPSCGSSRPHVKSKMKKVVRTIRESLIDIIG